MSENEKQNSGNDETRERIERMKQNAASGNAEESRAATDALIDKICQEMCRQQSTHGKQLGELRRELKEQRERSSIVESRQKQIEDRMHRMERESLARKKVETVQQSRIEVEEPEPSSNRSLVLEIGVIVLVAAIAIGVYLWMERDKDESQQPQKPDAFWDLGGNGQ